ncbi:unnamed protein product [Closterium sp. NIES-65]|nr:unnamed protein product [Closterium sp. NIES-65]
MPSCPCQITLARIIPLLSPRHPCPSPPRAFGTPEALESLWAVVQHVPEGSARVLPAVLSWHAHHTAAHPADGHGQPLPKELLLALIGRLKERLRLVHAFEVAEHVVRSPHYWLGKEDWRMLLDVCVRAGRVTRAEEMFTLLPRHLQTEEVYMGILHNYARRGLVRRVESRMVMLRALGVRESALGFEARMLAYGVRGLPGDVERVAREMASKGIPLTPTAYEYLMQAYALRRHPQPPIRSPLSPVPPSPQGIPLTPTAYEHLMQAYARRRHLPSIRALLHRLAHSPFPPSLPTLTVAAWAFFSQGRVGEAQGVVQEMRALQAGRGEGMPVPVLVGLAWAYARIGDVRRVEEVVGELEGIKGHELRILHMARIYCYAVAGRVKDAEKAFAAMQQAGHAPTTAAYNCLLIAYTRSHRMHDALSLLATMRASHMLPDATTYHHLITGALNNEDIDSAVSLLLQAAAAAAAGHPWSWKRGSASPRVDGPNPVVDAQGEDHGSEWGVRDGGGVGARSGVGSGGWVRRARVVGGRKGDRGRRRLQVRVGVFLAVVERLAEAGEVERLERVVSEVGKGVYAMDAGMYNLILGAVLRGARRGNKGKGVGEAGWRGVEGEEEKGSEVVVEEDSKRDGDDGGDFTGDSGVKDVGVEEQGQERRVEGGVRRVLRLLRASRIRPNVQTRVILAGVGLVRLLDEEGLSEVVPR